MTQQYSVLASTEHFMLVSTNLQDGGQVNIVVNPSAGIYEDYSGVKFGGQPLMVAIPRDIGFEYDNNRRKFYTLSMGDIVANIPEVADAPAVVKNKMKRHFTAEVNYLNEVLDLEYPTR